MTSRERVKRVLEYKNPDRVPVDLWGSASRLHTSFYMDLIKHLSFSEPAQKIRPGTTSEYEDYRISDIVKSDFRHINIGKPLGYKSYTDPNGNIIDEWGIGRKLIGSFSHISFHPLESAVIDDLDKYKWPFAADPGRVQGIEEQAKSWYENTDFAITATSPLSGMFFELAQFLRGTENFLTDMYVEPDFAHKLLGKIADVIIEMTVCYVKPIGKYIEWVEFSSDYGMQNAPFISRDLFKKFFKKHFIELFTEVKKAAPNIKVFLHSCGSIRELIPEFIDMGLDILNPLQPLATGMDSAELKKEFGRELVFHGGIDIQKAMTGTREDVRLEVIKRIQALAPGGGYICSPANHIQSDIPVENFFAMYEFAHQYGVYPIK